MPIAAFAYGAGNLTGQGDYYKASMPFFMSLASVYHAVSSLSIIQYFSQDPALTILGVNCMRLATVLYH